MNEQLREYIENERSKGVSDEDIRESLLSEGGWSIEDLEPFFVSRDADGTKTMPVKNEDAFRGAPEPEATLPSNQQHATEPPLEEDVRQEVWSGSGAQGTSVPKLYIIGGALVVLLVVGVGVSSGMIGSLFSKVPYSQDNLIQGLVSRSSQIENLSHTISLSVSVKPRDADTKSFEDIASPAELEEAQAIERDNNRFNDIRNIQNALRNLERIPVGRKTSLESLKEGIDQGEVIYFSFFNDQFSIRDPLTDEIYTYTYDDSLKDYVLEVTFETDTAISSIQEVSRGGERDITLDGKTAFYTSKTSNYTTFGSRTNYSIYRFDESGLFASDDFFLDINANTKTNIKPNSNSDLHFTLGAAGSFADIGFEVGGEFIKKDNDIYFMVTDFPGLLEEIGLSFSIKKNQWFKISLDTEESAQGYVSAIPEVTEEYKKQVAEYTRIASQIAAIADEEKVLVITNTPEKEKRDGGTFYRYDLELNKDNLLSFLKRMKEVIKSEPLLAEEGVVNEEGLDLLLSGEYDLFLSYLQENLTITIFVDDDGFLREQYGNLAIVPSSRVELFEGKQVNTEVKIYFNDINEPINIEAPSDARDLNEYLEETFGPPIGSAAYAKDASIISSMQTIRILSEIYYEDNGESYGNVIDSCSADLFSGEEAKRSIEAITEASGEAPQCRTSRNAWAMSARLSDGIYWCTDSTGHTSEIESPLSLRQTSCN